MTLSTLDEVDPHDPHESHDPHELRELREFEHLEARLVARFSPPLRPEEVQACVVDCVARYESARVRQYLPVLIERDARQRLGDLSRARMIGALK